MNVNVIEGDDMVETKVIAPVSWIVKAVNMGNKLFSFAYCCKGQGVCCIIPAGKHGGLISLMPFVVGEVSKRNGECEFARSCLTSSCPYNKATYETIVENYKWLGLQTIKDAKIFVKKINEIFEMLLKTDPELKNMLCNHQIIIYKHTPIRLMKKR